MPIGVKGDRNGSNSQLLPFDILETINVFSASLCGKKISKEDLKRRSQKNIIKHLTSKQYIYTVLSVAVFNLIFYVKLPIEPV